MGSTRRSTQSLLRSSPPRKPLSSRTSVFHRSSRRLYPWSPARAPLSRLTNILPELLSLESVSSDRNTYIPLTRRPTATRLTSATTLSPLTAQKTRITLRPAQAYHNFVENWSLEVDDKKVSPNKNEKKTIKIESDSLLKGEVTLYWHSDNVVEVNTPHSRITHKGRVVSVEEKSLMADGSHCGLCGDYSMIKSADIKSPKECVLSTSAS